MELEKYRVPTEKLRWRCDPEQFEFKCASELQPLQDFIGQERAIRSIEFGLAIDKPGYNVFVAGLSGTGRTTVVKTYIEKLIAEMEAKGEGYRPDDWCYFYNFKDADRPEIASLPQGKGRILRDGVSNLLEALKEDLRRAFSSDEYKSHIKRVMEEAQSPQQKIFEELGSQARDQGFLVEPTPMGPVLIPIFEGRAMTQSEYLALDEQKRKKLEALRDELLKKLQASMEKVGELEKEKVEKLRQIDKEVAEFTTSRLFDHLVAEHKASEKISRYLADLKAYTLDNVNMFKGGEETGRAVSGFPGAQVLQDRDPFLPFKINIFVDNSAAKGPPVIIESNPNFGNVFGRIERRFLFGGYLSDHTMLKPGAFSLANGGYLLLNARDVLLNVAVWPALKRAIRNQEIRIEEPFEQFGLIAPQGLRPEPMPVKVKVILLGDPMLYQMLSLYDEDFWEIFKAKADFDFEVDRTQENIQAYCSFISGCCREMGTKDFDRTGVARIIEHAARLVADQDKLSARFAQLKETMEEAEFWANKSGSKLITAEHVDRAVKEKIFRHNLMEQRIGDMINRGTIMIDTEGAVVGQVNGLSVYSMGDIMFGKPSRITAKTFLGRSGIINIERESQLSGRIHDKGVMILSGYLGWKYAQNSPLSLSASLCFEQSYEGVEGDSASSTELYAILSSISNVSIKQGIAVTGSVNQKGEIQPIGGVNHKIEGFFDVCKAKGLTGEQGVLIPHRNLKNLMLRDDVVEAVRNRQFHIYAAKTIDEGMEVLTGKDAGAKQEDGAYPEGSVNYLVDKNLKDMAERLRAFQSPGEAKDGHVKEKQVAQSQ